MPNGQLGQHVGTLEEYMKDLSFQALRTEREIARPIQEMRDFKDEMRRFKDDSLYVDESVVRYATSRNVLAMGMREDTMGILNPEAAAA